jgi:hypothetical protein
MSSRSWGTSPPKTVAGAPRRPPPPLPPRAGSAGSDAEIRSRAHGGPGRPDGTRYARPTVTPASLLGNPVLWWTLLIVVLSVLYLVVYVLLRTSADRRPWYQRLRSPGASAGAVDDDPGDAHHPRG